MNCAQAARIAGPLSRRKSAIVLKSGARSRPDRARLPARATAVAQHPHRKSSFHTTSVEGGPSLSIQRSSQKGGERAYTGRLEKDRSPGESCHSIASAKQASPPRTDLPLAWDGAIGDRQREDGDAQNALSLGRLRPSLVAKQAFNAAAYTPRNLSIAQLRLKMTSPRSG